jgi:hypothetical protein
MPPDPGPSIEFDMTRRRKRLWERLPLWHCPRVGTCIPNGELRQLAKRIGIEAPDMSNYLLHAPIVASCDSLHLSSHFTGSSRRNV